MISLAPVDQPIPVADGGATVAHNTTWVIWFAAVVSLLRGVWQTATPTITATTGTFTTVASTQRYQIRPNAIRVSGIITITTNNSAAGQIKVPLPKAIRTGAVGSLVCWIEAATPTALLGRIGD